MSSDEPSGDKQGAGLPTRLDLAVEAWKVAIESTRHFDNIELTIRTFAVSFLGVVIGSVAVLFQTSAANFVPVLVLAGLVVWIGCFLMEVFWYHRYLKTAVKQAECIEVELEKATNGTQGSLFNLTTNISKSSRSLGIRSTGRLLMFYGVVTLIGVCLLGAWYFSPHPALGQTRSETIRVVLTPDSTLSALLRKHSSLSDSSPVPCCCHRRRGS